jgi:hypothetical protein
MVMLDGAVVKRERFGLIVTATEADAPAASRTVAVAAPELAAPSVKLVPLSDGTTTVMSLLAKL